jgi:hypothetical protein
VIRFPSDPGIYYPGTGQIERHHAPDAILGLVQPALDIDNGRETGSDNLS